MRSALHHLLLRTAAIAALALLIGLSASAPANAAGLAQPAVAQQSTSTLVAKSSNPWGYNFSHGHLIYHPPARFCRYFACIPSFWHQTKGYVVQCRDGKFSHSGGRRGSCSYHGGNRRPLLAP